MRRESEEGEGEEKEDRVTWKREATPLNKY